MTIGTVQELFNKLIATTTPAGVSEILSSIGDVADIGLSQSFGNLNLHWHPYGGTTSNYSTIGLASKPGRSITERITNAIDAILEERHLRAQSAPASPQQAVNEWFGRPFSNPDTGLFSWKYSEGGYDRKVGIILSESGKSEAPTVDIIDFGIGIPATQFPSSILSLQGGNKITKKYLVGAFGQGGASTLNFSDYVLIVSRHVQNPEEVSFTLIKEVSLGEDYKQNCWAYLALYDDEGKRVIPSFTLNKRITLYPRNDKLRLNDLESGTLVRHYAFRLTGIAKSIGPREGNLYHYLHSSMFDPLLPFQIIDIRDDQKPNQQISTGSRNRLMKLIAKADSEIDSSNSECKLYRPFVYIRPFGAETECVRIEYWVVFNYEKKKNKKTGADYYDLRGDSNSLYVQKRHPAILTLNGQNQGELTIFQVSKDLGLDLVLRHIVIHIDVTEAPKNVKNQLFTTNRESLKDGEVLESIKQELRRILSEDTELKALDEQLVEKATSEVTQSTDNEVKKQIVSLLREAGFMPSAEGDATRMGAGKDSSDPPPPPAPPPSPPSPPPPLPTLPYPQVSKLEIVSPREKLEIQMNRTGTIKIETDADSRYKDELRLKVEPDSIEIASYFPLYGGRAKWRLKTNQNSKIGDVGKVSVSLTMPNGDQLKDEIDFEILEQVIKPAKEEKGFIPDFEVLPTTPGDENWSKAWDNISEDSDEVTTVAYVPRKFGLKTIVYYSTVFTNYKSTIEKLSLSKSPMVDFFDMNYKVWIGYHAILQLNSQQNDAIESDEHQGKIDSEREKERALVAQMQVKQALKSAELMLALSKQKATEHIET